MPEKGLPPIRWTKAQEARLKSAVRSFNSALSWAKRNNPEASAYLPQTASYRGLRDEIRTARELNNVVNRLKRGGKAKDFALVQNDAGTVTTKWQLREAQISFSVRERAKSVERTRLGTQNAAGIRTGNIGTIVERNLRPSKIRPGNMTLAQMERIVEVERERTRKNRYDRAKDYYTNYVIGLQSIGANNVGDGTVYDEILTSLANIMRRKPSALADMFASGDEALQIDFIYDEYTVIETRLQYALDAIRRVEREVGIA